MTLNGGILQGYRSLSLSLSLSLRRRIFGFWWTWWPVGPAVTPKNQSAILASYSSTLRTLVRSKLVKSLGADGLA